MPRPRTNDTRLRDLQALDLRRQHRNYRQIADDMGYSSVASAYAAVQRALVDVAQLETCDELIRIELDRLDEIAAAFLRVMGTTHYQVSVASGKVARDPDTDEPMVDDSIVLQAGLALLRVMERRAKYRPMETPVRHEVSFDSLDAQIAALTAELAGTAQTDQNAPAAGAAG